MVRLKVSFGNTIIVEHIDFNSKMVRLKVMRELIARMDIEHFNSKMVRLKALGKHAKNQFKLISIPKWYD